MQYPIYQVDAFTGRVFGGNPAAVVLLNEWLPDETLQAIAAENNLSETAFLIFGKYVHSLRWFTPTVEGDLCGHATLASAHALWELGLIKQEEKIRFHTRSGLLTCVQKNSWIELNFPAEPAGSADAPPELLQALDITPRFVGKNRFDYLVEVHTETEVRNLAPDFERLKALGIRGAMVTAPSDDPAYDFVSRFFAPGAGINEDPVTGSAHCCLAPFWGARLNKRELTARQISHRGGTLRLRLGEDRVFISGQAVTVLKGELLT